MKNSTCPWTNLYRRQTGQRELIPESFVTRILTSEFPAPALNSLEFSGKHILDLSCGYGRNLGLLLSLGFDVTATEITPEIVAGLEETFHEVRFLVGKANNLPLSDNAMDYVLSCNSCYYIEPGSTFEENLAEIHRVLSPGGYFIGSILCYDHSILDGAYRYSDGSALVASDSQGLRNGTRLQFCNSKKQVEEELAPYFSSLKIGLFRDEFLGFNRSFYYFTGKKR